MWRQINWLLAKKPLLVFFFQKGVKMLVFTKLLFSAVILLHITKILYLYIPYLFTTKTISNLGISLSHFIQIVQFFKWTFIDKVT